jgi:hypothetical protein
VPPSSPKHLRQVVWRYKGTLLIQTAIFTVGFVTRHQSALSHQHLVESFGFDYGLLREGALWHLLTGTWIQSTPGIQLSMIALVLSGTVFLEHLAGSGQMLATVLIGDWISTVVTAISLRVLSAAGSAEATNQLFRADSGSSALAHAGLAAATMLLPARIRLLAAFSLIVFTLAQFFTESFAPALAHAWAVLAGLLIGRLLLRHKARTRAGTETARPHDSREIAHS